MKYELGNSIEMEAIISSGDLSGAVWGFPIIYFNFGSLYAALDNPYIHRLSKEEFVPEAIL